MRRDEERSTAHATSRVSTSGQRRLSTAGERTRGPTDPAVSAHPLFRLQRDVGNRIVQRLVAERDRSTAQPTLQVTRPNDRDEREAAQVAEAIVRTPDPVTVSGSRPGHTGHRVRRLCSRCRRRLERGQPPNCADCERTLRRRETTLRPGVSTEGVDRLIESPHSGGRPLPAPVRARLEPRFGHDFGHVRVHTDARAAAAARSVDALAFTVGRDVFFDRGQFDPETVDGTRLLAHELTHVIQHGDGTDGTVRRQARGGTPGVVTGPSISSAMLGQGVVCLYGLLDDMRQQSREFLPKACRRGRLVTVATDGVVKEDAVDAFGHCWIACEGSQQCGESITRALGTMYELIREYTPYGGEHNSYEEDLANQAFGRALARTSSDGPCDTLCLRGAERGFLELHGEGTLCYSCAAGSWSSDHCN
jgi:hypothetical protein